MKTQNFLVILVFGALLFTCCIGAILFRNHRRCLKCGEKGSQVTQHNVTCSLEGCNYTYWNCQETHTHCPACQIVVDSPETARKRGIPVEDSHEDVCVICEQKYFRCQDHFCHLPWDYSRSDPQSEKDNVQKLSPTGTLPRPRIENTVIDK